LRRIGSIYSGIAGLELGLLAAFVEAELPARIAWQCEIDPFCSRVLAHHFPDVQRFSDVATVSHPPEVDVLCGGFACQDVSSAGRGAGLGKETRSGFTLHHLLRIIDEIEPRFLAIENVASGAKRWLPRVVQELVDRGYRPRAVPLGAIDVGAPHLRRRVFVVADRDGAASRGLGGIRDGCGEGLVAPTASARDWKSSCIEQARRQLASAEQGGRSLPDAECGELREQSGWRGGARGAGEGVAREHGADLADSAESRRAGADGGERPGRPVEPQRRGDTRSDSGTPQPGVGGDPHGLPFDVARHTFPAGRGAEQYAWESPLAIAGDVKMPDRPAKLRALGNGVVPQCGLVVGRILIAMGA